MAQFGRSKAYHQIDVHRAIESVELSLYYIGKTTDCATVLDELSSGFAAHGEAMTSARGSGLEAGTPLRGKLKSLQDQLLKARRRFHAKCVRKTGSF